MDGPEKWKSVFRQTVANGWHISSLDLRILKGQAAILMYHRVLGTEDLRNRYVQSGMYVRTEVFRMQMEFLRTHFHVLSLEQLLALWRSGQLSKGTRYCVITFDDGWLDNYRNAFPILKELGIPATIFIPTALIGSSYRFWPDKLSMLLQSDSGRDSLLAQAGSVGIEFQPIRDSLVWALKRTGGTESLGIYALIESLKGFPEVLVEELIDEAGSRAGLKSESSRDLLDWSEVREMSGGGVSFGSHTLRHKILSGLSEAAIREELSGSLKALHGSGINAVPVLAYPNGNCTPLTASIAKEVGYEAAVTTKMGLEASEPTNLFELRRVGIHDDVTSTVALFSWRLSCAFWA